MKRLRWIGPAAVAALFLIALPPAARAVEDEKALITGAGDCTDASGLELEDGSDASQARFACLANRKVQQSCDLDGRIARLNAFRQWIANLDRFQKLCEQRSGTFSYQSIDFTEPQDENFCARASVEVSYGQFENPICHFVSRCPAIPVVCRLGADDAASFHIPPQAVALPGVPIPIPIH